MSKDPIIESFARAGQEQVFAFWDRLSEVQRTGLLEQAKEIDLEEIGHLNATLLTKGAAPTLDLSGLAPAPYERRSENGGDSKEWAESKAIGEEALRKGRVAAFTVAGGQGTRLGYDGPKGTFPVTPIRNKTLFQVFAEKILAAGKRYGKPLHWFIMTSHANHDATEAFFGQHDYFGLNKDRVHLFRQGRMPAVDFNGKILLEAPDAIAMSPDGHGGSLRALDRSGALELMKKEGIDTISYFQVDNPLVRFIDPAFIGWHLKRRSEMSSKMVPKAYAEEKVGHFCSQNGKTIVVEYSDLPMSYQQERTPGGELRYLAGSVAIHLLDRDFVRRMARPEGAAGGSDVLPFHRADKKIPTVDASGNQVKPTKPNGVKFEMFVFDALPSAKNPVVIEARRADDFSPVKNAEGLDSPKTCKEDQLRQFARWLQLAGKRVETDGTGLPRVLLEVSPLFGYDEDSFLDGIRRRDVSPEDLRAALYLE